MDNIAVLYTSHYGFTARYADGIAQALSCPLFEQKQWKGRHFRAHLSTFDTIIYGGGLYAGGVSGLKLFCKMYPLFADKKIILFTCGLADPGDPANRSHIRGVIEKTLPPEMYKHAALFHLRGGIDYSRLHMVHKSMMAMLRHMLLKRPSQELRSEDRQVLQTYGTFVDFTDLAAIRPLVSYALGEKQNS